MELKLASDATSEIRSARDCDWFNEDRGRGRDCGLSGFMAMISLAEYLFVALLLLNEVWPVLDLSGSEVVSGSTDCGSPT